MLLTNIIGVRSYVDACTGALGVSRKVHLFSFYKGKIMDDLEKRKIYNLIQLALQAFQSNKYQIMERSGVGGVKSVD